MVKIFPYLAGETLKSHEAFLKQLTKKPNVLSSYQEGAVVIVFCPIVSRFETDINAALSNATDQGFNSVILVAMHHTFNEKYPIPNHGGLQPRGVRLLVDCLFFENKGLLDCTQNKQAVKAVSQELKSSRENSQLCCLAGGGKKEERRSTPQIDQN